MTNKTDTKAQARRERLKQIYGALNIYGTNDREELFLNSPSCKRRYAALGRKVLKHYLGDQYNPHTVEFQAEHFIREMIETAVQAKVLLKYKGYDWEFLDNSFKKAISFLMNIDLPYDQSRIQSGINPCLKITYLDVPSTKQ